MTMTMVMPSSSSSSSKRGLRGPRPLPLKVSSSRGSSPASKPPSNKKGTGAAPVIVYEHTPKVVHARPQEFMTVVQRLTGKPAPTTTLSSMPMQPHAASFPPPAVEERDGDPLLLTLGQRRQAPMAAGLLMSPAFIFSPNTMQSIQELSPLF